MSAFCAAWTRSKIDEQNHVWLQHLDAYWRAANFLSVGQNFIYAHLNRVIRAHGQDLREVRNWRWKALIEGDDAQT